MRRTILAISAAAMLLLGCQRPQVFILRESNVESYYHGPGLMVEYAIGGHIQNVVFYNGDELLYHQFKAHLASIGRLVVKEDICSNESGQ